MFFLTLIYHLLNTSSTQCRSGQQCRLTIRKRVAVCTLSLCICYTKASEICSSHISRVFFFFFYQFLSQGATKPVWGEGVLGDYVIVIGVLCRVFRSSRCSRFQCIKMRPAAPAVLLRLIQALRVLRAPPASLSKPLCVYLSRTHTCILMCLQCGVIICHCGCLFSPLYHAQLQ